MKNFKTKNGIFTGNVGIGTTGPGAPLHIYHTAGDTLILEKSSTEPTIRMKGDANNDFVQTVAGTNFRICKHDGATSLLEIKQNGNVGIGATNPSHDLTLGSGVSTGTTSTRLKIYRGADDPGQNLEMGYGHITVTRSNVLASPQSTFSIKQKGSDGERIVMHIDTDGSVGIGTTNPFGKLEVKGGASYLEGISLSPSSGGTVSEINSGSGTYGIQFKRGSSDTMTISSAGNVGIGSTDPGAYKLDVANSQTEFVQKISNGHSSSAYGLFVHLTAGHDNKTSEYIRCVTGNGNINFNVYSDGTIFADGASLGSDDRIKHNEEKIVNAVETLSKITPKKYFKTTKLYDANHDFDLNSDGNPIDESGEPVKHRVEAGVIAQEVLGVDELKFAVSPETKDENGNVATPYALNYNSLFTYAIAAIQEQQQLIEDLKSRIETLES